MFPVFIPAQLWRQHWLTMDHQGRCRLSYLPISGVRWMFYTASVLIFIAVALDLPDRSETGERIRANPGGGCGRC